MLWIIINATTFQYSEKTENLTLENQQHLNNPYFITPFNLYSDKPTSTNNTSLFNDDLLDLINGTIQVIELLIYKSKFTFFEDNIISTSITVDTLTQYQMEYIIHILEILNLSIHQTNYIVLLLSVLLR